MKKIVLSIVFILQALFSFSQNPSYTQKLYYTGKIWGFVKYFHSRVSECQVNWDSVLISRLPSIKNAVTNNDFNNALDTLLNAAGGTVIVPGVLPDTISPALKRNRNFSWMNDPILRTDVRVILDTIKNNFRPHPSCWIQNNNYTGTYTGWLEFPHDSLMMNGSIYSTFPDEWHRISLIYRYWNIINYFNPYNYVTDVSWDSTLFNNILSIASAKDADSFFFLFYRMTALLNDAHVFGQTYNTNQAFPFYYSPRLVLKYIPNKYIVVKSGISSIAVGDEIQSVDGLPVSAWEDSLRPYISAGNSSIFRYYVGFYMLCAKYANTKKIVTLDSIGQSHMVSVQVLGNYQGAWFTSYHENDTIVNTRWEKLNCDVGYVNMGKLDISDVNAMYTALNKLPAIIFDVRNYPNGTAWAISNLMYASPKCFSRNMLPDVTYPGTCFWQNDSLGIKGNANPYTGKVIILMNESTGSQAEYSCMMLAAMPNAIKVGSQTAGTDGNITYFNISKDTHTGFTTLGIYYPNGDSTERIGIKPDSVVYHTQNGIRHHRDELLEKALEIANCLLAVRPQEKSGAAIRVYPNPSSGLFTVELTKPGAEKVRILITDILGRILVDKMIGSVPGNFSEELDLSFFSSGMYLLNFTSGWNHQVIKLIKD
jgi:carboxyl-terminal processing protease